MDSKQKEEKGKLKLSKLGFGFKLVRFTSVLSVTWIITALAGCSLGLALAFIDTNLKFTIGGFRVINLVLGGIFLFCTFSFLTWGQMYSECRAENVSGIEEIAKAYSYVYAILNLILNLVGLFLLSVYEHLKAGIEFIFSTGPGGPILVLLIFLIGIFYSSKLIHGLRTHQDRHLGDYIVFRYFILAVTIILTIIAMTVFSINFSEQILWTTLCGFLGLALGCLNFMLDVGPTIILHSIWSQESNENPKLKKVYTIENPDTPIPDSWYW